MPRSIIHSLPWLRRLLGAISTFCVPLIVALVSLSPAQAQETEQATFTQKHPVIRYAVNPSLAPIEFLDKNKHTGLARDYLDLIAKGSGLKFERSHYATWGEAVAAFERHELDLLSASFVSVEREKIALFSDPYFRLGGAILTLGGSAAIGNVDQLANQTVGLVGGTVWRELLGENATRMTLVDFSSQHDALKALAEGKIAALVSDPLSSITQARELGLESKIAVTGQLDEQVPLALAVRRDWPELVAIINAQLATVTVEQEQLLRARWFKAPEVDKGVALTLPLPDALRPRLQAMLSQLAEDETEQRGLLEEALKLEDQADALLGTLNQPLPEEPAAPAPRASTTENLSQFLLWRASLPERADTDQLQAMVANERNALIAAEQRRDEAALRLQDLTQKQTTLPAEIGESTARANQLIEQARTATSPAQGLLIQTRQRLYLAQTALLQRQLQNNPANLAQAAEDIRAARLKVTSLQQRIAALNELQRTRVVRNAQGRLAEIEQAQQTLGTDQSEAVQTAAENLQLAQLLVEHARRYAEAVPEQELQARLSEKTASSLNLTRQRLELNAGGAELGRVLVGEIRNLDTPRQARVKLQDILSELATLRLRQIEWSNRAEKLNTEVPLALIADEDIDPSAHLSAEWQRRELRAVQSSLIDELLSLSNVLRASLERTSRELSKRQQDSAELTRIISEQLLWLPTQPVRELTWFLQLPEGAADLFKPSRWSYMAGLVIKDSLAHPIRQSLIVLLLIGLWLLRRRVPSELKKLAELGTSRRMLSMAPTIKALVLSMLAAAFWPAMCLLLGGYLQGLGEPGRFTDSLGLALVTTGGQLAMLTSTHWLTHKDGLARHFSWPAARYQALHKLNLQVLWLGVPVTLIAALQTFRGSDLGIETLSRPLFMLFLVRMTWLSWTALRPGGPLSLSSTRAGGSWWNRHIHWPLPLIMAGIAALQIAGFSIVCYLLFWATAQSLYLLLLLLVFRQLVVRWLLIQERKLAHKRYQQRMEARLEEQRNQDQETSDAPTAEPEDITVASIGEQTRRLLRATLITLGCLSILWIWSDLLPLLQALDKVELWRFGGESGDEHIVSLRKVLFSLIALTLTMVASRNLPGLLEIAVLQRVPIDAATRYAVTSLCRYVIVIGGLVYGVALLGVRWGDLQWMAAALTVGLGFGLQEIFANFVSGLILLFERPFRVGDTITVDNLSGTVTRIRTRATTIVDWDNKEIVVPNKTFITGQLVNWTLTDAVTRLTIPVGAAYGSDPERVLAVLREVAQANPLVLTDPKPTSWLLAFGASSIDFELRVFVAEIRHRLPVTSELTTAIHNRFAAEGIEIPFPQMDLHVRTPPKA